MNDNSNDKSNYNESCGPMWDKKRSSSALAVSGRSDDPREHALARVGEAVNKLGALVRAGETVEADAQRLLLALASYGEGSRRGRYAFTSAELCGVEHKVSGKRTVEERGIDDKGEPVTRKAEEDAWGWFPTPTEQACGIPGARLSDAASLLVARGWAEKLDAGPFAPDCDFHEVKLTAQGREAAQKWVGAVAERASAASESTFPSIFADPKPVTREKTDLEALQAMLTRAKVSYAVDGGDESTGTTAVGLKDIAVFTFGEDGKLMGVGKTESACPSV
jgi:hypothetical protein